MEKAIVLGKPVDTIAITQSLGLQTFRRSRHLWSKEDDELLLNRLHQLYPELMATPDLDANKVDWRRVAEAFGDSRKAKECRRRWVALLNPNLRRGRWTADEDQLLLDQYNLHGPLWQTIARNIQGRSEHQCSKRYREILDPGVRDRLKPWTDEEDLLLVRMISKHGTKWKTIAQGLELRLSLTCRNRWRTLTTNIARGRAKTLLLDAISQVVEGDNKDRLGELLSSLNQGTTAVGSDSSGISLLGAPRGPNENNGQLGRTFQSLNHGDYASGNNFEHFSLKSEYAGELNRTHEISRDNSIPDENNANADYPTSLSMSLDSPVSNAGSGKSTLSSAAVPVKTEDEWTFNLLQKGDETATLPKELASVKGSVNSEQLVQHLVLFAALRGVDINVYHHVHHHYQNNQLGLPYTEQRLLSSMGADSSSLYGGNAGFTPPPPSFSFAEYEAQRKRHQHFNYLPPLMAVPQLTSSVVSAPTTHHHHHHHHHHHTKEDNSGKRARNDGHEHTSTFSKPTRILRDHIDNFEAISELERPVKRTKSTDQKEDADEEIEFFESLRNLRGPSVESDTVPKAAIGTAPVSQHHPLHYTGGSGALPESFFDADAEDLIDSYGQFYHLYLNDPVLEKRAEETLPFGAIPFNPS